MVTDEGLHVVVVEAVEDFVLVVGGAIVAQFGQPLLWQFFE